MRIVYLIDHLGAGGAQKRLSGTVPLLPKEWSVRIAGMNGSVEMSAALRALDGKIIQLGRSRLDPCIAVGLMRLAFGAMRPDIIHTHLFYAFLGGFFVTALSRRVRFVAHINHLPDSMPAYVYRWYVKLQRWCDKFIAINETVREKLVVAGVERSRISVGTIAADMRRRTTHVERAAFLKRLGIPPDAFVILRTARLSAEKSHEYFLRVFHSVREQMPQAVYVMAGDGPLRARLESAAAGMGLRSAVFFLGHRNDIDALNAVADMAFVRGYGTESVEHLRAGVPVCSLDSDGAREILRHGENGFIFGFGDERKCAEAIIGIGRNRAALAVMKDNARKTINERFSFSYEAEVWRRVYAEVSGVEAAS